MTVERRRLRIGVAGAGWVASERHVPAFRRDPRVEVVSVYDRSLERATRLARRARIPHASDHLNDFFAQDLDIVAVCTSPWTHASLAIESLQRGCHVLSEKPMALSSDDAIAMVRAAEAAGRILCLNHNFLFSRSMLRIKSMMERDELGPIHHIMAIQSSNPNRRLPEWYPRLPGGLFFDEAPHMIYLLRYFMGDIKVEHVRAQIAPPQRSQPLDVIEASLAGNGITASLTMTFVAPVSEWYIVIFGQHRVLVIDLFRDILTVMKPDGNHSLREVVESSLRTYGQLLAGFVATGALYLTNRARFGQDELVRRFLDSVAGSGPPPVTPEQAVGVLQTMEAILVGIPGLAERQALGAR